MRVALALFLSITASPALAKVVTQAVPYKQGKTPLVGYLAFDDDLQTPRPGVVVVHEWWGLNDYAKQRARELAGLGYVAFAVDMYGKGETTSDPKRAGELAGALKKDTALARARAKAGFDVLRRHGKVDPQRMAAIGYCFGGTMALQMAYSGLELQGVVSFHGHLPPPGPKDAIKAKLLVCHGAADPHVPPKQVQAFQSAMKGRKVDWQLLTYGGALHAFTNPKAKSPERGAAHHPLAARRAWRHMREFLARALTPAKGPENRGLSAVGRRQLDRLLSLPHSLAYPSELLLVRGGKPTHEAIVVLTHAMLRLPYDGSTSDERKSMAAEVLDEMISCEAFDLGIEGYFTAVEQNEAEREAAEAKSLVTWVVKNASRLVWDEEEEMFIDPGEEQD